jgi:hypothetical protein
MVYFSKENIGLNQVGDVVYGVLVSSFPPGTDLFHLSRGLCLRSKAGEEKLFIGCLWRDS